MEVMSMYMEPISGGNTQMAAQQQVMVKVSNSNQSQSSKQEKISAPKAVEANKKESTDGVKDVQIAKESDESVTLSIPADKQLVDEQKNVNLDKLKKIMEQVTASLPHSDAKFGIHEKTNRITIKLIDRETQEVIKEIPPERTLDLLAKRMELAGVLVDKKL